MTPLDALVQSLRQQFPQAEMETRRADAPDGFQFLDLFVEGLHVSVEWKPDLGFGVSSHGEDSAADEGLYEPPSEWWRTAEAAFHRIASLILDHRATSSRPTRIAELRQQRGLSQEALSGQLRVKQATYSKLERRGDMKISSLRKAIEAMGGKLRIQAVFPDTKEVRDVQLQ